MILLKISATLCLLYVGAVYHRCIFVLSDESSLGECVFSIMIFLILLVAIWL